MNAVRSSHVNNERADDVLRCSHVIPGEEKRFSERCGHIMPQEAGLSASQRLQ